MPTPRRPRPTRSRRSNGRSGGVETADVTPEEIASIRASVEGREQAPSSRQQAGSGVNWARVRDTLGDPFDVERIPLSRLKLMRRDPMLSFGLSFIKTPFARAKWFINASDTNGPNAQVSANVDWALRRIFASYVFQWSNMLEFGFQAIAKRYEQRTPTGTYVETNSDTGEQTEVPIWSEGGIQPIVWKPFVALPPDTVEPIWTPEGDFGGIKYTSGSNAAPGGVQASQGSEENEFEIDVPHSLWATHAKDENFGSIFGYPRLGYAYRYWWSYWFRWAIADRAFERKADPATIVRHPDGGFEDEFGQYISHRDYALEMGERLRSGATVSLPSEVHMGEIDGKPSTTPIWDIEFTKDATNFDPFDKSFDYLDVQKLRSLWIPEQAFLEGKGGTSSRNVAKELGESFVESQAVLASQLVDTINRWIIPQFLALNFPEFMANGGTAEIVMQGFADQDVEARNQLIQLLGQQDFGAREMLSVVDIHKTLEDAGIPLLDFRGQKARETKMAEEAAAEAPPETPPVPGEQVGIVPTATGFTGYIQPREVIYLSDRSADFLERLPASPHYSDSKVRREARILREEWRKMYDEEYGSFAEFLASLDALEFADGPGEEIRKAARKLVRQWETNLQRLGTVLDRTTDIYKRVMNRASALEAKRVGLEETPADDAFEQWVKTHAAEFVTSVEFTTREELTDFLAERIESGMDDPKELAEEVRQHFSDFPDWKADRLARTEIRDAYNAATLLAAQANGIDRVQALDGTNDPDCEARNGQIFSLEDAAHEREHPNGTLGWRILPVELSWRYENDMPEGVNAFFDRDTNTIVFSAEIDDDERRDYLLDVAARVVAP